MKSRLLLILLLAVAGLGNKLNAQTFNLALDDDSLVNVYPEQIVSQSTSDGGSVLMNTPGNIELLVLEMLKLNSSGTTVWHINIADTSNFITNTNINGDFQIKRIVEFADGSFVIVGESSMQYSLYYDKILIKISSTGTLMWAKSFASSLYALNDAKATSDGGMILTSGQSIADGSNTAAWLLKLDASGNRQWEKQLDFSNQNDFFYSVTELASGGYIASGLAIVNQITFNGVLVKLGSNGNVIWSKTIPGSAIKHIDELPGGNLMIATDVGRVSKIDSNGNAIWTKKWTMSVNPHSQVGFSWYSMTSNKEVVLSGILVDQASASVNVAMKIDTAGNVLWANKYVTDSVFPVPIYTFGATAAAGNALLYTMQNIVQTDSMGHVPGNSCFFSEAINMVDSSSTLGLQNASPTIRDTASVISTASIFVNNHTRMAPYNPCNAAAAIKESVDPTSDIIVYPNPSTGKFTIVNKGISIKGMEVYNLLGERVLQLANGFAYQSGIDLSAEPAGIYFIKITTKEGISGKKIVKE